MINSDMGAILMVTNELVILTVHKFHCFCGFAILKVWLNRAINFYCTVIPKVDPLCKKSFFPKMSHMAPSSLGTQVCT